MGSTRTGKPTANQFIIATPKGRYFQSYNSVIAFRPYRKGKVILDKNTWDYSVTTRKYRNVFLGESTAQTREKIDSGEYLMRDLNAPVEPQNMDNIYNPDICSSSLDEYGEPMTEGETAHKWDDSTDPITCAECGTLKD